MGIDVWEVIEAASTKPFGFMPFYPGPGLGGHCIPIDPFYLTYKAKEFGINTKFIELAGEINTNMPNIVINKLTYALSEFMNKSINKSKILIIGMAYKKDVDDMRESPSLDLIPSLVENVKEIKVYDPIAMDEASKYIRDVYFANNIEDCIENVDVSIILTEWSDFRTLSANYLSKFMKGNVVIDFRNALNPENFINKNITLHQIGRGPFN